MDTLMISLYPDDDGQERIKRSYAIKRFYAAEVQRTILSREADIEYPHVFAACEELRSLRFLHLNPEILRQPSSASAPPVLLGNGGNLPTTLARIRAQDPFAFHCVWLDLANLVPGILEIELDEDEARNQYIIRAKTDEQRSFSSQVLSDGTLRLLALATLRNDPQFHGMLCLEEPENGVHPSRLKNMVRLLRETATDFSDPQQADEPLRQVLVTTHSPMLISQPDVVNALLFAYTVIHVEPGEMPSLEITCMTPVITSNKQSQSGEDAKDNRAIEVFTIDQVKKYLDSEGLDKARERLEKARATLNER